MALIVLPNKRKVGDIAIDLPGKAKDADTGRLTARVYRGNAPTLRIAAADVLRSRRDPTGERKAETLRTRIAVGSTLSPSREWLELKGHHWTERMRDQGTRPAARCRE